MKRLTKTSPFLWLLVSLVAGIYLHATGFIPASCGVAGLLGATGLLFLFHNKKHPFFVLFSLNIIFLSTGIVTSHLQIYFHENLVDQHANKRITLDATIIEKHVQPTTKKRRLQNEILELEVFQITQPSDGNKQHASFKLQCFLRHPTNFQVGDQITIKNVIIKPPSMLTLSQNPSFGDYLIKEGMLGSIFLTYKNQPVLTARPSWSIRRWIWNLRNITYQTIMRQLSPQSACYFSLIFLGKKDPEFTDDLRRTFNYWGLSHYLARSGIHIILFILIWQFFLGLLPLHLTIKRLLLILICGTYGLLSWASTPFIRAYYSFLIIESGKIKNFQPNYFHLLTLMCMVMLLFNPKQLFSLDFQLTFGLTFALVWLAQQQYSYKKQNTSS